MDTILDSAKLARDLIYFQENCPESAVIRRFPSSEDIVVVNPFILELNTSDALLKMAISFNEYPASLFPKIIFQHIPICPFHEAFPHPNININTGVLELRPSLLRPCIRVLHAVNYINYILASPVHYQGSCLPNYLEDFSGPLVPPPATGPLYESLKPQSQGDTSFMDFVKDLGVIFAVIKTGIEIGKVFMTLIGL